MTTTTLRGGADVASEDDRASALIWFAEQARIRWTELDPVLPEVVAALAHPTHVDAGTHLALFEALKDAVNEAQRFDNDPSGYMDDEDGPRTDRYSEALYDALRTQIDLAAFDLVNPGPSCTVCRRSGPRQSWRAAVWPSSLYCEAHRQARRQVAS
jgi:hypothetical protein